MQFALRGLNRRERSCQIRLIAIASLAARTIELATSLEEQLIDRSIDLLRALATFLYRETYALLLEE
jgi:hypothetical protein